MYKYKAFGLNFESSFEVPELIKSQEGDAEVFIHYGVVPENLDNPIAQGVRFQATEDAFLLTVDNISRYYVRDGREIIVERKPGSGDEEVRLFLLGSAFGALFHQRGLLPLHASTIDIGGQAIALCGTSGSGKSTFAASFVKAGCTLLSDDISVVTFDDNNPIVWPGYPQMKLWADAVKYLGDHPGSYRKIRPTLEKRGVVLKEQFSSQPCPLLHIFVLSVKNTEGIDVVEVKGMEKFNMIKSNTYRFNFTRGVDTRAGHLKQSSILASKVGITKIVRPRKGYHDKEMRRIINELVKKK